MYAEETDRVITADCGCKIQLDFELSTPNCRCGGGCWDDEKEFDYSNISIIDPCARHDAKF